MRNFSYFHTYIGIISRTDTNKPKIDVLNFLGEPSSAASGNRHAAKILPLAISSTLSKKIPQFSMKSKKFPQFEQFVQQKTASKDKFESMKLNKRIRTSGKHLKMRKIHEAKTRHFGFNALDQEKKLSNGFNKHRLLSNPKTSKNYIKDRKTLHSYSNLDRNENISSADLKPFEEKGFRICSTSSADTKTISRQDCVKSLQRSSSSKNSPNDDQLNRAQDLKAVFFRALKSQEHPGSSVLSTAHKSNNEEKYFISGHDEEGERLQNYKAARKKKKSITPFVYITKNGLRRQLNTELKEGPILSGSSVNPKTNIASQNPSRKRRKRNAEKKKVEKVEQLDLGMDSKKESIDEESWNDYIDKLFDPEFDSEVQSNISAVEGQTVHMGCRVNNLGTKTVSE